MKQIKWPILHESESEGQSGKPIQMIWVTKTWQSKYSTHFFPDYPKYNILWHNKEKSNLEEGFELGYLLKSFLNIFQN